ncbi:Transposase and inactivated derivatives, IS30 family, partial [Dysosmobacter welbionis]
PDGPLSLRIRRIGQKSGGGEGRHQDPDRGHLPPDQDSHRQPPAVCPAAGGAGPAAGEPGVCLRSGASGGEATVPHRRAGQNLPAGERRPCHDAQASWHPTAVGCRLGPGRSRSG